MSLEATDTEAAAVAVGRRVTLDDIKTNIIEEHYFVASEALYSLAKHENPLSTSLDCLTICLLVLKNGFTVIGKAAPAVEANFNRDLGRKFAYEDAVRQVWPLMGYGLRQRLMDLSTASLIR